MSTDFKCKSFQFSKHEDHIILAFLSKAGYLLHVSWLVSANVCMFLCMCVHVLVHIHMCIQARGDQQSI